MIIRRQLMRIGLGLVALSILAVRLWAKDCSFSNEFRIETPQVLSGVLRDPQGLILPGIELELLSGGKRVQKLRTDNRGAFNFGQVSAGRYKIRIKASGVFCAPKVLCGKQGCQVDSTVSINSKNAVTVY